MAPNLELKIAVSLDKDGKPFVKGVEYMTAQAQSAVAKSGEKMRKSLSEIFAQGFFIRAGLGALALARFAQAANEPSERLRRLTAEGREAAAVFGSELQSAIGATLAPLTPLVTKLKEGDGAFRGMAAGAAGFLSVGINIIKLLIQLGTKANVATALVSLAFLGGGAALGKYGEKAKEDEDAVNDLYDSIKAGNPTLDENKRKIEAITKALADLKEARSRGFDTVEGEGIFGLRTTGVALPQRDFEAEQQRLEREGEARKRINEDLESEIKLRTDLQRFVANPTPENAADAISRLNAQIALGRTTLTEAREEIKKYADDVTSRIGSLSSKGDAFSVDKLFALTPERKEALAAAKTDAEKQKILDEQLVELKRQQISLDQFRADLGDRISTQSEKDRSETLNRLQLQAQIADIVRNQGPVLERQVVQEQIRKLLGEGHKENEIQVLQLRMEDLKLTSDILQLETQRADEAARHAKERRDARETDRKAALDFSDKTFSSLNILGGSSESAERQRRIRELQRDLGLATLSVHDLNEEFRILANQNLPQDTTDADRAKFSELVGLLQQEAEAGGAFAREQLATVQDAAQSASRAMGQAFVSMFDQTEDGAKRIANTIKQIMLQMAGELVGNALFMLLISLLTGGGGGAVGSIVGGGIRGGGPILGGLGLPSLPSPMPGVRMYLPIPQAAGGVGGTQKEIAEMRRDIRALTKTIGNSHLQQIESVIDGHQIRTVYKRVEANTTKT